MDELYATIDAVEDLIQSLRDRPESLPVEPGLAKEIARLESRLIHLRTLTPFFKMPV